ncbi:MAG TPA: LysE family translocator [Gammaproteobacteria bacterium]|jgi:threonine/homoserine/homoserine lactone efflux protein|nr:LysE family translocator [Gammaproteobacteria bacterium]
MTHYVHLWLFFILVLSVVVQPGMDMAYILGSALTGGLRMGFMAIFGIMAGAVYHVTIGTLGIGVLLKLYPAAFNLLLLAGSLYIAWIGFSIFRNAAAFRLRPETKIQTPVQTFRRGILTNILNPKAYLFTLAVYPQFIGPEYGPLAIQAVVMWLIIAVTQISVYGTVAVAAHGVRHWLTSPDNVVIVGRVVGCVLMLGAVFTALSSWKGI